jgi:hypothetical protein
MADEFEEQGMRSGYATFNVADYLDNADVIAEFLWAAA